MYSGSPGERPSGDEEILTVTSIAPSVPPATSRFISVILQSTESSNLVIYKIQIDQYLKMPEQCCNPICESDGDGEVKWRNPHCTQAAIDQAQTMGDIPSSMRYCYLCNSQECAEWLLEYFEGDGADVVLKAITQTFCYCVDGGCDKLVGVHPAKLHRLKEGGGRGEELGRYATLACANKHAKQIHVRY